MLDAIRNGVNDPGRNSIVVVDTFEKLVAKGIIFLAQNEIKKGVFTYMCNCHYITSIYFDICIFVLIRI